MVAFEIFKTSGASVLRKFSNNRSNTLAMRAKSVHLPFRMDCTLTILSKEMVDLRHRDINNNQVEGEPRLSNRLKAKISHKAR